VKAAPNPELHIAKALARLLTDKDFPGGTPTVRAQSVLQAHHPASLKLFCAGNEVFAAFLTAANIGEPSKLVAVGTTVKLACPAICGVLQHLDQ